ncbi:MAG TPA: SRPBCC domain-containing protein [Rugosimonospora sp.]|nr:SRPBCC domain-containing protein [Rugosimonospora sp.]
MASLTYRPGSKQDPSYAHEDGTHTLLVTDIMQKGTAPQVYRALTDPVLLRDWTGTDATATDEGTAWRIPALGLAATSSGEVEGETVAVELRLDGWQTSPSVASIRLWPVPHSTLLVINHRHLAAADLDRARELWAPQVLDRLRRWVAANAPSMRRVGIVARP